MWVNAKELAPLAIDCLCESLSVLLFDVISYTPVLGMLLECSCSSDLIFLFPMHFVDDLRSQHKDILQLPRAAAKRGYDT